MEALNQPKTFPEVNAILREVLSSVQSILGGHFIGMYLYGSLATGGFDRDSDVDFIVVTDEEVSDGLFAELHDMHTRIKTMDSWCAAQLEGSYIPCCALKHYDPVHALYVHIDRGRDERLQRMHLDNDRLGRAWWGGWILLRSTIREHGIILAGPDPNTLIDPVPPSDLWQAALSVLNGWAADILNDPAQIKNRGYQSYTVLTLCRILYTFHFSAVISKPEAIRWAQETLDKRWMPLIDSAWLGRQNPDLEAEPDDINGTLEFIRYTIEQSQHFRKPQKIIGIDLAEEILNSMK
jgi:predicted nucleotidyltransferase